MKKLTHIIGTILIFCMIATIIPSNTAYAKKLTAKEYAKKYIKVTKYKLDNCFLVKYENKGNKSIRVKSSTSFYKDKACKTRIKVLDSENAIFICPKTTVYAYFDTISNDAIGEYNGTKVSSTFNYLTSDYKIYNPSKTLKLTYDLFKVDDEDNYYNFNIDIKNKTKNTLAIGMILIITDSNNKLMSAYHVDGMEIFLHSKEEKSLTEELYLKEEPNKLIVNTSIYY